MKIQAETLEELVYGKPNGPFEDYGNGPKLRRIFTETGDEHRWYTDRLVTFQAEGDDRFWQFCYMDPASEMQEDQDRFDVDRDGYVECPEVFEHVVITKSFNTTPVQPGEPVFPSGS